MFGSETQRIAATVVVLEGIFDRETSLTPLVRRNRLLYIALNAGEMDSVLPILCVDY